MKAITVIAKITSSCNLRCPYCYTRHTVEKPVEIMSLEIFEKIIQSICLDYNEINLIFHGGEPLLAPLSWYIEAVEIIKKYQYLYKFTYKLAMQSNITLMNDEYNDFFIKENIRVGFSYDGLTNYKTRKNTDIVIRNKSKYESIGGAICLITKDNWNNIENEIDHFEEIGFEGKFNIVFNTTTGVENELSKISKYEILECYKRMFEHIIKKEKNAFENTFDLFISKSIGTRGLTTCGNGYCIGRWIGIHSDGSMYPCGQEWDMFEEYSFGNIKDITINDVFKTEKAINYKNTFDSKLKKCIEKKCSVFDICNGSCPGENKANGEDIDSFVEEHCYLMNELFIYINEFLKSERVKEIKNEYILNFIKGSGDVVNGCKNCR